jgi:preprotein translocase subunit SecA
VLGIDNLYAPEHFEMMPYLDNALRAHALYRRDKDYIVRGSEVIIVDEFTGRLMEGRRYSEGLHQAIEAKEGVKVQKESMTLATITFQNFFRMYNKLAGMTGTAKTEEEEFQRIYNLDVCRFPPTGPLSAKTSTTWSIARRRASSRRCIDDIVEKHKRASPCWSARSPSKQRVCEQPAQPRGIEHEVLNAKNHEREATIIAQAGRPGAVTIATNMAGRGVDILLGGNAEGLAREQLRRRKFDLTSLRQTDWNRTLDMLKRGKTRPRPSPANAGRRCCRKVARDRSRQGEGAQAGRPACRRHRTPRGAAHRQPVARPLRPSGRPRLQPLLPEPGR